MKVKPVLCASLISLLLGGCFSSDSGDGILSQQFVHKYGFPVTEAEWTAREGDGQIVEILRSGVKITRSYENGALHGPSTYTFPHSNVVEKLQVFDQGTLLKEVVHDGTGMPMRQDVYEFDNRVITTLWDAKGAPLSIEEHEGDLLVEGRYYTPTNDLESEVDAGFGHRVKRERSGQMIARERMENGIVASRTTFHPNGEIHTVSNYDNFELHGEQLKFSASGEPLMKFEWDHGVLDGIKVVFRNGYKVAEIPYHKGKKHGVESHFDNLGKLTAEVEWKADKKHGCAQSFTDENLDQEWYYEGQVITQSDFKKMEDRDRLIAELNGIID